MIKIQLFVIFLIGSIMTGYAQRGMSAEEYAKQETELLKNEIEGLTDIQLERIYNVNLKYAKKIRSYKQKASRENAFEIRGTDKKVIANVMG